MAWGGAHMHVLLGILTAIVSILYALDRLGVDIGGMNPFYWYRRRSFTKKYGSDPIYSVDDPVHIAALLIIGAAKLDGDLTAGQKQLAQDQFVSEFSIDTKEATQLFGSAAHLLAAPQLLDSQLEKLVDRNQDTFAPDQANSLMQMIVKVASADGELSAKQQEFIDNVRAACVKAPIGEGPWA
jgi:uncharacterized tellurite resistance protein B-like protein